MNLYPHQSSAAARTAALLTAKGGALLWADVGSGKTATALTAATRCQDVPLTFVVAPKRVCFSVWPQEIAKWLGDWPVVQVCGLSPAKRAAALTDMAIGSFVLVNYEMLPWLLKRDLPDNALWILDEVDKMKSHQAARVKKWLKARKPGWSVLGMTGTPMPNHYMELWGQVASTALENPLMRSFNRFRNAYFYEAAPYKWAAFPDSVASIREAVLPMVVHMEPPIDNRPAVAETTRTVELPAKARTLYKDLERDYIAHWNDHAFEAINAGVLWNKLRSVAQGAVMDGYEDAVFGVHDEKLSALKDLVGELQGSPLLVVFHYRWQAEQLAANGWPSIYGATKDRDATRLIDEWNKGEHEVMGIQPMAAGHGLNLQGCNAHHVCFLTLPLSAALKEQTIGRLRRVGNESDTIYVHTIETTGTVDEDARKMLGRKETTQAALWAAARERVG